MKARIASELMVRKTRSMPKATANGKKSARRAVEHVFAHQKNRFDLFIRTIGLARAEAKLTLANLAYNFNYNRLILHERRMTVRRRTDSQIPQVKQV